MRPGHRSGAAARCSRPGPCRTRRRSPPCPGAPQRRGCSRAGPCRTQRRPSPWPGAPLRRGCSTGSDGWEPTLLQRLVKHLGLLGGPQDRHGVIDVGRDGQHSVCVGDPDALELAVQRLLMSDALAMLYGIMLSGQPCRMPLLRGTAAVSTQLREIWCSRRRTCSAGS